MSAEPGADAEVVIVGFGPVGATLAILLAQLGHRVVVLERWQAPYPLPRAVHFDHEVGRILQGCGIGPALREISEPAEIYEWRNAAGTTLLRFGRIGAGASGWPESSMFNQPALEALLAGRVRELPGIEVRCGIAVTSLDRVDGGVVIGGIDGHGDRVEVRGAYVVGCDGANSTIRSLVGAPVVDLGFFYDWLIVDVVLDEPRVFDPLNLQVCDPARPTTAVSGGPGRRRWEFMRLPHERTDDLDDERRAWELLAAWDVTPPNATLERHAVYTFNARYAERWRVGRAILAGDAAHQMPPFAGQGLCAGVRDAANLAWKLELVLAGRAPDALLDTFELERQPDARAAIELSMELGKVICVPDPVEAALRDEAMSATVGAELSEAPELRSLAAGLVHPTAPGAGRPFVQGTVSVDGRIGPLDDLCGGGWRLVTTDTRSSLAAEPAAWFAAVGGRVLVLDGARIVDVDGTYARWFQRHGTTWALQRPDHRLHGTADSSDGAADLLRHLADHLAPVPTQGAHS